MGKRENIKQAVMVLTHNNRAYDDKLDAYESFCERPKDCVAYELNSLQKAIDDKSKQFIQFIGALSFRPIKIFRSSPDQALSDISVIASQAEDREMTFLEAGKRTDGRTLWIGIALAVVAVTFAIAIYIKMQGA
jgi:hypothetical protein